MHIVVWKNTRGAYFWHFTASNGKVTACAESFPSRGNAIRAAKAVVRAVCKPWIFPHNGYPIRFVVTERDGVTVIKWA